MCVCVYIERGVVCKRSLRTFKNGRPCSRRNEISLRNRTKRDTGDAFVLLRRNGEVFTQNISAFFLISPTNIYSS